MSKFVQPTMFTRIQTATMIVWAMRKVGVPKNRAKLLRLPPNQSLPNADWRWAWGR